jgi:hypothetical protein
MLPFVAITWTATEAYIAEFRLATGGFRQNVIHL